MIEPVVLIIVGATMIAGAAYDAATLTIPNWISLLLFALFPLAAFSAGLSWGEAGIHLAIGVAALLAGMGLFAAGVIGGGDAKLFSAVALYMGIAGIGGFILAVAIAGGGLACALIAARWCATLMAKEGFGWARHLLSANAGIPYGIAIVVGGLFVLPQTRFFMIGH